MIESEKSPLLGKRSEDEPKSFDVITNDKAITSTMYKDQFIDRTRDPLTTKRSSLAQNNR